MENNSYEYPFISCKCITAGRPEFLEEAIESFLGQNYPSDRCELVIVNDYEHQELIFDHPRIRIFNIEKTFSTIGEKENYATSQCRGDIICQWDDDDIALSNHLLNVAKWLKPDSSVLHWANGAYWNEGEGIVDLVWLGNSGIAFWKECWREVGKFPIMNAGCDSSFVQKLHALKVPSLGRPEDDEVTWFYRWGFIPGGKISKVGCYHQSGQGTDDEIKPNVLQRHRIFLEERRKNGLIPSGKIELNPQWHYDYEKQLKHFKSKRHESKIQD